ncbi:fruR/shl operon leader peptide [Escherichia coli]|nr:fruR/shl operon leader peptide [Escherichia coli]AUV31061.1 fruR/shl operon leader peptide [Escherichia coli]
MRNLQPNMSRWAFFAKSVGTWNKTDIPQLI